MTSSLPVFVSTICFHSWAKRMWLTFPLGERWLAFQNWRGPSKFSPSAGKSKHAMTEQIADGPVEHLNPQGVAVIVEANHLCMKLRVNKTCSSMQTFAMRGSYKADRELASQIVNLICNSRR